MRLKISSKLEIKAKKMHLLDAFEAQAVHFFQHEERITLSLLAEAQSKLSAFG